jgi:hypothetical protein
MSLMHISRTDYFHLNELKSNIIVKCTTSCDGFYKMQVSSYAFAWKFRSSVYDQSCIYERSTTNWAGLMVIFSYEGGTSPVKGDILVIAGATLYAISNVSEVRYRAH